MSIHNLGRWIAAGAMGAVLLTGGEAALAQREFKVPDEVFTSIVKVHAEMPSDARSAETLGTEREGSGVVIDGDGLIVTIGYLVVEANKIELTLHDGRVVPANFVGFDPDSGFGLVKAAAPLRVKPIEFGDSDGLKERDPVMVASFGGREAAIGAFVVSRRTFAGYWEYLLENAIFTSPPHLSFGGAGLIGRDGKLYGVGSLIVPDAMRGAQTFPGNMFVPIDALKPILGEMLTLGRSGNPARPWIGVSSEEVRGRLFVTRVARDSPAQAAGVRVGDLVLGVGGKPIDNLADFYRAIWALGEAGVSVPLNVLQGTRTSDITVRSVDRFKFLKLNQSY